MPDTPRDTDPAADAAAQHSGRRGPPQHLQGQIVTGVVTSLAEFGAFVAIPDDPEADPAEGTTHRGLVHVSEVADQFVDNIYAHVGEGDVVQVKVLEVAEDGKISLSMKQAVEGWGEGPADDLSPKTGSDFDRKVRKFMHRSQRRQGEVRRQRRGRR